MTSDRLVLTNANVIDCVGERPVVGGSVTIERGRIVEVLDGSRSPDTRNADFIELDGAYLLPGPGTSTVHAVVASVEPDPSRGGSVRRVYGEVPVPARA